MKKLSILLIIFLSSCSLQNTANYWNDNIVDEKLDFTKEHDFEEYGTILEKYNDKKGYPELN